MIMRNEVFCSLIWFVAVLIEALWFYILFELSPFVPSSMKNIHFEQEYKAQKTIFNNVKIND